MVEMCSICDRSLKKFIQNFRLKFRREETIYRKKTVNNMKNRVKVKQSCYRPGGAQRFPGS